MKKCYKCGFLKPLNDFHLRKSSKDGYQATCKLCQKIALADRRKADPIKHSNYQKKWRNKNPERAKEINRKTKLKTTYGISPEQFNNMLADQDGCCKICKSPHPHGKGTWHIDHCHSTGKLRGLLCHYCNTGLGAFRDNLFLLKSAMEYLENG